MIGTDIPDFSPEWGRRERYAALPIHYSDASGMVHYLDSVCDTLTFCENVRNVTGMLLFIRSASAVTGNAVLQISAGGTEVAVAVIPVTAADRMHELTFESSISGLLTIRALTSDVRWTLRDTEVVSVIVSQDIYVEVIR